MMESLQEAIETFKETETEEDAPPMLPSHFYKVCCASLILSLNFKLLLSFSRCALIPDDRAQYSATKDPFPQLGGCMLQIEEQKFKFKKSISE